MSPEKSHLRIQKIGIFLYSFVHSLFSFIWMFLVLYVITPYHIEIWEAALMVHIYAWLVLTAFILDKNFFKIIKQSPEKSTSEGFYESTIYGINMTKNDALMIKEKMMLLEKMTVLNEKQKIQIIEYYFTRSMLHSPLHFKILAINELTGSRHDSLYIDSDLKKLLENLELKMCSPTYFRELNFLYENFSINTSVLCSIIEFSSVLYGVKTKSDQCQVVINRTGGNIESEIMIK